MLEKENRRASLEQRTASVTNENVLMLEFKILDNLGGATNFNCSLRDFLLL